MCHVDSDYYSVLILGMERLGVFCVWNLMIKGKSLTGPGVRMGERLHMWFHHWILLWDHGKKSYTDFYFIKAHWPFFFLFWHFKILEWKYFRIQAVMRPYVLFFQWNKTIFRIFTPTLDLIEWNNPGSKVILESSLHSKEASHIFHWLEV